MSLSFRPLAPYSRSSAENAARSQVRIAVMAQDAKTQAQLEVSRIWQGNAANVHCSALALFLTPAVYFSPPLKDSSKPLPIIHLWMAGVETTQGQALVRQVLS